MPPKRTPVPPSAATAPAGGPSYVASTPGPVAPPPVPPLWRRGLATGRNIIARESPRVQIPGVPSFLGNRVILGMAWGASMAVIFWDEWKVNGILARPSRLWATTLVYLILAALSAFDAVVPLVNALGLGYLLMLMYQYYNKAGQFA